MRDPRLFILPCRLGDSKPFDTLADLGSCVNLILLNLFKKLKIRLLEETKDVLGLVDGTKSYPWTWKENLLAPYLVGRGFLATANVVIDCKRESYIPRTSKDDIGARPPYFAKRDFWDNHLPEEEEITRDARDNKMDWDRPPKEGDGARHIRIEIIDPDGEKFDRAFQSILKTRKVSPKENPSDILNLDYFHNS
ncbi:hypothetical protein Tco_0840741 [Tanacetum coccineum]|uniref:Uncharacterized protein n=1 Tax=Tanacetum coccineum TaxID=301880 RepID=A0ABQ5AZC7_9ASTR